MQNCHLPCGRQWLHCRCRRRVAPLPLHAGPLSPASRTWRPPLRLTCSSLSPPYSPSLLPVSPDRAEPHRAPPLPTLAEHLAVDWELLRRIGDHHQDRLVVLLLHAEGIGAGRPNSRPLSPSSPRWPPPSEHRCLAVRPPRPLPSADSCFW